MTGFYSVDGRALVELSQQHSKTFTCVLNTTDKLTVKFSQEDEDGMEGVVASSPLAQSCASIRRVSIDNPVDFCTQVALALNSTPAGLSASHQTVSARFCPPIIACEQIVELLRLSAVISVTLHADCIYILYAPKSDSKHSLRALKRRQPELFTANKTRARSFKTAPKKPQRRRPRHRPNKR